MEKKKRGRPTDNPKEYRKSYRLSNDDMQKMQACNEKTGMTETDIIRRGIDKVYQETQNKTI